MGLHRLPYTVLLVAVLAVYLAPCGASPASTTTIVLAATFDFPLPYSAEAVVACLEYAGTGVRPSHTILVSASTT